MTSPGFARLIEADIRHAWSHEATEFTPWMLANLDGLSEAVGIPLEPEATEVRVGRFRADVLARNATDNTRVLIENQLGASDHSHLGQILTYLAGLDAQTIIWVATGFDESHLSALKWLNESTQDRFAFFAVRVKVVRIADSPFAPIFEVLERPNNWERTLHAAVPQATGLSELGKRNIEFWSAMIERYPDEVERTGVPNAQPFRWRVLSDINLVVTMYVSRNGAGVFVRGTQGSSAQEVLDRLMPHSDKLAAALGAEVDEGRPGHYFSLAIKGDANDPAQRARLVEWLQQAANRYESALRECFKDQL